MKGSCLQQPSCRDAPCARAVAEPALLVIRETVCMTNPGLHAAAAMQIIHIVYILDYIYMQA